jgi:hypothetical protein
LLEGDDSYGDYGLGCLLELRLRPLLVFHIHISPSTSSGQRNCASWTSQPQKSVTLLSQLGGEATESIRDMWWHWPKNRILKSDCFSTHLYQCSVFVFLAPHVRRSTIFENYDVFKPASVRICTF